MLQARMSDFTYIKHAHEEYSFGVTLAGRQDFFAGGAFYRSLPGTVMVFNPDLPAIPQSSAPPQSAIYH